jgi:DNA-binding winged helix-turn-helix (wHTH) protein
MTPLRSVPVLPPAFEIGGWMVEPAFNRLKKGRHVITLEPKVMRLLLCLRAGGGEVITREELLSRIWQGVHVVDGVLPRAAYQLRKSLFEGGVAGVEIETIRQVGYRLVETPIAKRRSLPFGRLTRAAASPAAAWTFAMLVLTLSLSPRLGAPPLPAGDFARTTATREAPAAVADVKVAGLPSPLAVAPLPRAIEVAYVPPVRNEKAKREAVLERVTLEPHAIADLAVQTAVPAAPVLGEATARVMVLHGEDFHAPARSAAFRIGPRPPPPPLPPPPPPPPTSRYGQPGEII